MIQGRTKKEKEVITNKIINNLKEQLKNEELISDHYKKELEDYKRLTTDLKEEFLRKLKEKK